MKICKFLIQNQLGQYFCFIDMTWECDHCLVFALKKKELNYLESHLKNDLQINQNGLK